MGPSSVYYNFVTDSILFNHMEYLFQRQDFKAGIFYCIFVVSNLTYDLTLRV